MGTIPLSLGPPRTAIVPQILILKNMHKKLFLKVRISYYHVQTEGGAPPKGVPTTGLAADTMPDIA